MQSDGTPVELTLSEGSKTIEKPKEYVLTNVAKLANLTKALKSETSDNSNVRAKLAKRSAQNLF